MSQSTSPRSGRILIGTSGWHYAAWRGDFYPDGLRHRDELPYLSERLDSVEVNGTHYSLQKPSTFTAWAADVPPGFVFSVKASRYITHIRRLRNADAAVADFFASGVLLLGPRIGPILWQLPANLRFDADVLEAFCRLLPHTIGDAAQRAADHDGHVDHVHAPHRGLSRRVRHVVEARHESFDHDECARVLRRHNVSLVTADSGGRWPTMDRRTATFRYLRLHGSPEVYASGYGEERLRHWSRWAGREAEHGDVHVYFDNDAKGRAPHDALRLIDLCRP